jgi:LmbE family N-acetylglucosaminyl deacetylase
VASEGMVTEAGSSHGQHRSGKWIFLSPHLDDVAFSCGGLLWEQAQAGQLVQVWTICAEEPPPGPVSPFAQSLQDRWGVGTDSGERRRQEDRLSCSLLGATARHFPVPDCIYRREQGSGNFLYPSEESLFGPLHPAERDLEAQLAGMLAEAISSKAADEVKLVCPLTLGGHVDHRLTRAAVERIEPDWPSGRVWYYADFPYVLDDSALLVQLTRERWESQVFPISPPGLLAWQRSMAAHASQISTFWSGVSEMEASLRAYCERTGGVRLWRKIVALR